MRRITLPTLLLLLTIFVFFVIPNSTKVSVKMAIVGLLKPSLAAINGVIGGKNSIFQESALVHENKALKKRIEILQAKLVELREASLENERLRGLLSFKKKSPFRSIPAQVIGRDSSSWSKTIIIDKGESDGIKPDMIVVASAGLVGKVIEVGKTASKVLLVLDPNFRAAALIQRTREEGIVEGTLRGSCRLKYLAQDADVKVDDIVITSGLGELFPKGIFIGRVEKIGNDKSRLYRHCVVKPAVRFTEIEEVLCIE